MTNTFVKNYERIIGNTGFSSGSSLKGHLLARYSDLVALLGEPEECDGYKVSGTWVFRTRDGECVTLYDWKSTNLYDPDYPSVEEFRASEAFQEFNVGGHTSVAASDFIQALADELERRERVRVAQADFLRSIANKGSR